MSANISTKWGRTIAHRDRDIKIDHPIDYLAEDDQFDKINGKCGVGSELCGSLGVLKTFSSVKLSVAFIAHQASQRLEMPACLAPWNIVFDDLE